MSARASTAADVIDEAMLDRRSNVRKKDYTLTAEEPKQHSRGIPVKVMYICGNAAGEFVYMRRCRCQAHVYAAMPLASSCICGNARGQVHVYAAMPLASSCIFGNAAGKRGMGKGER